ncbi:unnamed protein product, partial [Phaeothamnion confervicola]
QLWHQHLGHPGDHVLARLMSDNNTRVPRLDFDLRQFCEACVMGTSHRTNTNTSAQQRALSRLELVHSDTFGPLPFRSRAGNRYAIVFVDDSTRMRWIYFMRSTTEVLGCLKQFRIDAEAKGGATIRRFRADCGPEYRAQSFRGACRERGIALEFSAPYTQSMNGVAKRSWRSLVERARCMLEASGL